jgi:hypothetical protein
MSGAIVSLDDRFSVFQNIFGSIISWQLLLHSDAIKDKTEIIENIKRQLDKLGGIKKN